MAFHTYVLVLLFLCFGQPMVLFFLILSSNSFWNSIGNLKKKILEARKKTKGCISKR